MIARVSAVQGDPGRTGTPDAMTFLERAVPAVKQQPGFEGIYLLADRKTGEHLAITLWDTEQHAEAMAAQSHLIQLREEAGRQVGAAASPPGKNYEVILHA